MLYRMNILKLKSKKKNPKNLIEVIHLGLTGVVLVKIRNQLHQQVNLTQYFFNDYIIFKLNFKMKYK